METQSPVAKLNLRRNAFLTGASSGIGLATASALTNGDYEVWGTSRDVSRLPVLPHFHPVELDLNDSHSRTRAIEKVRSEAGFIDVLINNAGDVISGPLEALVPDGMRQQFETHLFGPLEMIRGFLPEMRRRNRGMIINVSSLAARYPIPFNAGYSAAKAALSSATECLRLELVGTGIRVVHILPGDIKTEILKRTRVVQSELCAAYEPNLTRVHQAEMKSMNHAPDPRIVANAILRVLAHPNPPRALTVGGFFEAKLLPILARIIPDRLLYWGHQRFFNLSSGKRSSADERV